MGEFTPRQLTPEQELEYVRLQFMLASSGLHDVVQSRDRQKVLISCNAYLDAAVIIEPDLRLDGA